jgi:thioredoxin 1
VAEESSWTDLSTYEFEEVLNSQEHHVIEFWAPWCAPCSAYEPILRDVATELGSLFQGHRVNVADEEGLAAQCGISSVPALGLIRDGALSKRVFGARGKRLLIDELATFFSKNP